MYRAPPEEGSRDQNPDNKLKRPSNLQEWGNEAMELSGELNPFSNSAKRQRVTDDQTGLPAISSCSELDKEICGLVAPIVRCPQNSKPSKSCTGENASEQDIHLEEGYQLVLLDNPVPLQVEEDGGCHRSSCCMDVQTARITAQVSASRGSQSIMSGQQELEGDIKAAEQMNDSEEASGSPKNEVVTNNQQVGYSILPQFLDSCFNLDDLKNCEQLAWPSEVVRGRLPVPEGTIPTEPSGYLLDPAFHFTDPLPCNRSNDDISAPSPHTQPQQHPPAISSSEPLDPLLSILSDTESPAFSQAEKLQVSARANSPSEPVLLYSSSNDTSFQSYNGEFSSNNQSNAAAAPISSRIRSKQIRGLC